MFYPLLSMTGIEWWVLLALAICVLIINILAILLLGRVTYHTKEKVVETKEASEAAAETIVAKLDVIEDHTNGTLTALTEKLEASLAQNTILHKRIEQLLSQQKGS